MIDLWTLFVVDLFQSFWLAILGLSFLFWIILTIGKVSQVTIMNFISLFWVAMAIGYGGALLAIITTIMLLVVHLLAIPRLTDS